MKTCVIYARVSTADQETQNQIDQLRDFAKKSGWTVTDTITDICSGGTGAADRNGLNSVFEKAHKKQFDILLFWSLDRLSREGSRKTIEYLTRLERDGVGWYSFTEQYLSSVGPFADCIISLLSTLAKQERIRISERTRAGLDRARNNGKKLGRPLSAVESSRSASVLRNEGMTYKSIGQQLNLSAARAYQLVQMGRSQLTT